MTFHFTADCTFAADDLDDAFMNLSQHFLNCFFDEDGKPLDHVGTLKLEKADPPQASPPFSFTPLPPPEPGRLLVVDHNGNFKDIGVSADDLLGLIRT